MEQGAAPGHRGGKTARIAQVADGQFERQAIEVAPVAAGADQGAHAHPARQQRPRHGGADEPGGAGYEGEIIGHFRRYKL